MFVNVFSGNLEKKKKTCSLEMLGGREGGAGGGGLRGKQKRGRGEWRRGRLGGGEGSEEGERGKEEGERGEMRRG